MSTTEALSNEIPCSWKYNPYEKKTRINSDWRRAKDPVFKGNEKIGPGYYENIVKAKYLTLSGSSRFSFPKSKSPDAISLNAFYTKGVPGVGSYPEAYNCMSLATLVSKSNRKIIRPYKTKRFLDDVIKMGAKIPGPGSYNIGPPVQAKKAE